METRNEEIWNLYYKKELAEMNVSQISNCDLNKQCRFIIYLQAWCKRDLSTLKGGVDSLECLFYMYSANGHVYMVEDVRLAEWKSDLKYISILLWTI